MRQMKDTKTQSEGYAEAVLGKLYADKRPTAHRAITREELKAMLVEAFEQGTANGLRD